MTDKPPKYISQHELAQIIGVNRTTITEWQRQGLPYEPQGRGKENRYIAPVVINWWAGRRLIEQMGLKITDPALTVLLGHAIPMSSEPDWETSAKRLVGHMNLPSSKFNRLFGTVQGILLYRKR